MPRLPLLFLLGLCAAVAGEDAFRVVPLAELAIEGAWPEPPTEVDTWAFAEERQPYAVLDGAGEAVVGWSGEEWQAPGDVAGLRERGHLSVRAPAGAPA